MIVYTDPLAYETIQREVEQNFHEYIKADVDDRLTIIIVGAYHGLEIQQFLDRYSNPMILAFEPVPDSFKVLHDTYKEEYYDNVICFPYAVSDKYGKVTFHDVSTPGCGSLKEFIDDGHNKIANSFEVQSVALGDTFKEATIDLLWVDTQGTELDVLKGVYDLNKVKSLFLEVTMRDGHIAYEGNCLFDELEEFLKPTHFCHSIGLDNEGNNGTGNSFWLHNEYK